MALIKLESKTAFLASRGLLAVIGFAKTVFVIRLLTLEDYAILGIVESVRVVVIALIGLGVSEAVTSSRPRTATAPRTLSLSRWI